MHLLVFKLDVPNSSYGLLKLHVALKFRRKKTLLILYIAYAKLQKWDPKEIADLSTS